MKEKRKLIDFVCSNSTWKDGRLIPKYRNPFDLLAVTNKCYQQTKATSPEESGLCSIWLPALDMHDGIQSHHGHGHIGWMGRDALVAAAQNRVNTVVSVNGGAACARLTFVTGVSGIVEVIAAGTLHQIAAGGRHVA
jgi:hypothetical protein